MIRLTLVVSVEASEDVVGILTYVATTSDSARARSIDQRIDRALGSLVSFAHRGRVVPELRKRGITTYREIQAAPYRIVYRVVGRQVWVLAVVDGRRDLDEVLYTRTRR